jgi:hypothetical protein
MKSNNQFGIEDFLISFLFHAAILLLFALIMFNIPKEKNQLLVEWLTDVKPELTQENFAPQGVQNEDNSQTQAANTTTDTQQNPVVDNISNQNTVARGIEPPVKRKIGKTNSGPIAGVSSSYLTGVKSSIQSGGQGGNGFQLDNDDGNIVILKQVLPRATIVDYGKVTLQFKIKRDGTVDPESILPVLIDNPSYTNASIVALKQWTFSYKSSYNSKAYRISFIFKPE